MQQTNAVARATIPEIRVLKKELLAQRQSCVQMFKRSQQDILMIQTCMVELSEKSLAQTALSLTQAALNSKLERMVEAAAEVACEASELFAKTILAQKP